MSTTKTSGTDKKGPFFYKDVDVTDVAVIKNTKGRGHNIVLKSDKQVTLNVKSPLMLLCYPSFTGEGNLGVKIKKKNGEEFMELDRGKVKFAGALGVGGEDEVTRKLAPTLLADQIDFVRVIYDVGQNIAEVLFDSRCEVVLDNIISAEKAAKKDEVERLTESTGKKHTIVDVETLMKTDADLYERVVRRSKMKFIDSMEYELPNPDDYDTDGNSKISVNGKTRKLAVGFKRKVWGRERATSHIPADEIPTPSSVGKDGLASSLANWSQICEKMRPHYRFNPFEYYEKKDKADDGDLGKQMPHHKLKNSDWLDPYWCPIGPEFTTLVQMTVFFDIIKMQTAWGLKIMPWKEIFIARRTKHKNAVGVNVNPGLCMSISDQESSTQEGPPAKRQNTGPPSSSSSVDGRTGDENTGPPPSSSSVDGRTGDENTGPPPSSSSVDNRNGDHDTTADDDLAAQAMLMNEADTR